MHTCVHLMCFWFGWGLCVLFLSSRMCPYEQNFIYMKVPLMWVNTVQECFQTWFDFYLNQGSKNSFMQYCYFYTEVSF